MTETPEPLHTTAVLKNWNEAHKYYAQARQIQRSKIDDLDVKIQTADQTRETLLKQLRDIENDLGRYRAEKLRAETDRDDLISEGKDHHEMVKAWCEKRQRPLPPVPPEYADPNQLADVNATRPEPQETLR